MTIQLIMGWRYVVNLRFANTKSRPHPDRFKQDVQHFATTQACVVLSHLSVYRGYLGKVFFSSIARSCQVANPPAVRRYNGLQISMGA